MRRRWVVRCIAQDGRVIDSRWFVFRRSARRYAQWQERAGEGDAPWNSLGLRLAVAIHGPLWTVTIERAAK